MKLCMCAYKFDCVTECIFNLTVLMDILIIMDINDID